MTEKAAPAAKTPAPRSKKPKAVSPVVVPVPVPVPTPAPVAAKVAADEVTVKLRRKDLVERVVKLSGAKPGDVSRIVEATLAVLGDVLSNGEQLALPPFGNARVKKSTAKDKGSTMMVSLRRGTAKAKPPKAPKAPKAAKAAKDPRAAQPAKAAKTGKQALAVPAEAD